MSGNDSFSAKYTNANLAPGAAPYDSQVFSVILDGLQQAIDDDGSDKTAAPGVLAAICCSQRRGDAVPKLFADLTKDASKEEGESLFLSIKTAISIVFPFVGLPNCVPACLGLVAELKAKGIAPPDKADRPLVTEKDWFAIGTKTREEIYRGVGNPEVQAMLGQYFPELGYISEVALFGWLIGGTLEHQSLARGELALAAAITGMGATRQATSHCKAALGVGNSVKAVQAVIDAAIEVSKWNQSTAPVRLDAAKLAEEVKENLAKQG